MRRLLEGEGVIVRMGRGWCGRSGLLVSFFFFFFVLLFWFGLMGVVGQGRGSGGVGSVELTALIN